MMYKNISPYKSSPRTHSIDRFTPHCIVGEWTAKQGADYFVNSGKHASANYIIGKDGDIAIGVEEGDRAWTSSSSANDNRAITVECASEKTSPYTFPQKTYDALIKLCCDVAIRYNKTKLVYIANKEEAIKYEPKEGELQLTLHRFFANKSCPGDWFILMIPDFISKVNSVIGGYDMDCAAFIEKVANLIKKYNNQFGFCNVSVPLAQCILESGWGGSELAKNANNYFGLKHRDGRCPSACGVYYKIGSEQNPDGSYSSDAMCWEKFDSLESCVKGYYEFLSNAPGGRYDNLKGVLSPDIYVRLIKDDGYATSLDYVDKILNVINKNELRKYDVLINNINTISLDELKSIKEECIKTINKIFSEYGV